MSEKAKTSIDAAFEEFETTIGNNRVVRREVIDMLRRQVPKCEIYEGEKAMAIQAKMMVIKTLDDLMKSDEDVSLKKLKMKLARQDSATNGVVGQTIVALLKNIRATGENTGKGAEVDHNAAMTELLAKKEAHKEALEISDGELESCGTSPTTDGNADAVAAAASKKPDGDDEEE